MREAKRIKLAPSVMCADFACLRSDIAKLERFGVDYLHFDIMDGHFVPNLTMGPDVVRCLRKVTDLPFDIHLMVEHPERYIPAFIESGGDLISVHLESPGDIRGALRLIRESGRKCAIALNPGTPISAAEGFLEDVSVILIMCVHPGFAGQRMVEGSIGKIAEMRRRIDELGLDVGIEVDGNVGGDNLPRMIEAGADILVCGTSSIFRPGVTLEESLRKFEGELRSCGAGR